MPRKKASRKAPIPGHTVHLKEILAASGLTRAMGEVQVQCATVCLDAVGHDQATEFKVNVRAKGSLSDASFTLARDKASNKMKLTFNDLTVATQHGACGIAILLVRRLFGLIVFKSAKTKTGIDYYLSDSPKQLLFQELARLEVSGLLKEPTTRVEQRVKTKIQQTKQSDKLNIPAYVVIVEFSTPCSEVVAR